MSDYVMPDIDVLTDGAHSVVRCLGCRTHFAESASYDEVIPAVVAALLHRCPGAPAPGPPK